MYRYVIIEARNQQILDIEILNLFSDFLTSPKVSIQDNQGTILFEDYNDYAFKEVLLNVMSDTLSDLRMYVSHAFLNEETRLNHLEFMKKVLTDIPFAKYYYMDLHTVLRHYLKNMSQELKMQTLQRYYLDPVMMETLDVYLESNLSTVNAAKKLYIHRNTLIQRLDKFYQITGLDVRLFQDALICYHLIH